MECLSTNAEPTSCFPVKQGFHARGHEKEQVSPSAWEQGDFKKVNGNHEGERAAVGETALCPLETTLTECTALAVKGWGVTRKSSHTEGRQDLQVAPRT